MSMLYVPIIICLPFSAGVNFFYKLIRDPAIANHADIIDACSLTIANLAFVAQGAVFICIADSVIRQYHSSLK